MSRHRRVVSFQRDRATDAKCGLKLVTRCILHGMARGGYLFEPVKAPVEAVARLKEVTASSKRQPPHQIGNRLIKEVTASVGVK